MTVSNTSLDTYASATYYFNPNLYYFQAFFGSPCYLTNQTVSAGFYSLLYNLSASQRQFWPYNPPYLIPNISAIVDGFFGGCTPLDALLSSTLDCLYNINCLKLLVDYFPALNQVCID
jgi:hypothetical protein